GRNQMKQLIAFACTALLFASCQKEETSLPNNGDGLVEATAKSGSYRQIYCVGCDQNGENCAECSCSGTGGGCLPDVVISKNHLSAVDDVFTGIDSHVQATIKAAFLANKTVLTNYLATTDINAVINGTATATAEPGPRDSRFILIRNPQGSITAAYPLYESA